MKLIVYTHDSCPKCKVLKTKLNQKGVSFTEKRDDKFLVDNGFSSVPVLCISTESGPKLMNFNDAIEFINKL